MITYLFLRAGSILARYIPVRLGYFCASILAGVAYFMGGTRRRFLFQNLTHVMGTSAPGQEIAVMARSSFRNHFKYYYELLRLPHMETSELSRRVHLEGIGHLQRAVRAKKGVVLISPHMGNWDLMGAALSAQFGRTYSVAERLRPKRVYDWFTATRAAMGIEIVPEGGAARRICRVLSQGGIVGLVCDRDLRGSGVPVSFFGATTTMPRGPVALALRTGAAIVPAFCTRQRDDTLTVDIWAPIKLRVTGERDRDVAVNTQKIADCFQMAIGKDPSQWFVMQPVWRENRPKP